MNISTTLRDALAGRLHVLSNDLTAAGHITHGLSLDDRTLTTADDSGNPAELSTAAQAFVLSWTAPARPASPNYGADLLTDDQIQAQASAIVTGLRQYIGLASPTLPQTALAVKALAQVAIYLIRQRFPSL